jgi:hypothetical protein
VGTRNDWLFQEEARGGRGGERETMRERGMSRVRGRRGSGRGMSRGGDTEDVSAHSSVVHAGNHVGKVEGRVGVVVEGVGRWRGGTEREKKKKKERKKEWGRERKEKTKKKKNGDCGRCT